MFSFNGEVLGSWCWSCAWFAEECAVMRGGHGHVCPAAGTSAVAGPGLGHLVLPVLGRPHVSTSHMEGNEGTCDSVHSCFPRGCCDSPQTAQPLPFQPGECKQRLLSGAEFSWLEPKILERPSWPEPLECLGMLLCCLCPASEDWA